MDPGNVVYENVDVVFRPRATSYNILKFDV
jgi:hypothetical protein